MTSVYLRPFFVDLKSAFREGFNPADPDYEKKLQNRVLRTLKEMQMHFIFY